MASVSEDQCDYSLILIGEITVTNFPESFVKQLGSTLKAVQDALQPFEDTSSGPHDQNVVEAVKKVHKAVQVSFILARAYISKAHSLAKYICSEEPYTIKAIEEGNVQEFRDYVEEVLDMSQACQKDMQTMLEFIDNGKEKVVEQEKIVDERKKIATVDATDSSRKAFGGGVVAAIGVGGIAGGALVGKNVAIAGIAIAVAVPELVATGAVVVSAAGPVIIAVGLFAAIGGLSYLTKNAVNYKRHKEMEAYCDKAIKAIEKMKSNLEEIQKSLNSVNVALKREVDCNFSDISASKLEKLSRKGATQRSLKQRVQEMTEGANHLKEYCQPLKESKNLQEFIQRVTT